MGRMRERANGCRLRSRGWPVVALLAAWPCAEARADEGEVVEEDDGAALVRSTAVEPAPEPTPTTLETFARELNWSRWLLADEAPTTPDSVSPTLPRAAWLPLTDLRADQWQARPVALTTTASALGSMLVAGLPVLGVVKDGKLRQRHFLRGYFRSRGIALVWRIEF
jgi:hypothetical protein